MPDLSNINDPDELRKAFIAHTMDWPAGCESGKREFLQEAGLGPQRVTETFDLHYSVEVSFTPDEDGEEGKVKARRDVRADIETWLDDTYRLRDHLEGDRSWYTNPNVTNIVVNDMPKPVAKKKAVKRVAKKRAARRR